MRADCRESVLKRFVQTLVDERWQVGDHIEKGAHTECLIDAAKGGGYTNSMSTSIISVITESSIWKVIELVWKRCGSVL